MMDSSFRVYHIGEYAYGWEEGAGDYIPRTKNLDYTVQKTTVPAASEPQGSFVVLA